MCNAALEEQRSSRSHMNRVDEELAAAAAATAAAAEQGSMDSSTSAAPRHRRPSTQQHHQHCLRRQATTPSDTASPLSMAETSRSSSVGHHSPARGLVEQCSQSHSNTVSNQQQGGERGDPGRRDSNNNWSLERAVAATWGAGEWLGLRLLRKRRRSGSSSLSCNEATVTSSGISSRRDGSREGGSTPSHLAPTPPPHPDNNTNNASSSFCGSKFSVCRKQQRLPFCSWRDRRSGGGGGGGGRGRVVTILFGAGALAVGLSLAWVLCIAASEIYIRTYCLQVRLMEAAQRPRGECPIVKLTRESRGDWGIQPALPSLAGVAEEEEEEGGTRKENPGSGGGVGEGKRLRFGIILMCDEGMWPREYNDLSISNKKAYAALHGYDVIVATAEDIDRSRPAAWSKLLVLREHLGSYDYVIFVDIDAFIMNPTFKLEWILDVAQKQQEIGGMDGWGAGSESDLIVTQDWNGPNSGVVLIRNSEFSRWLLQEWWEQKQFVKGNYPFQYEQRAMHFLLQTEVWKERGLPFYAGFEAVRAHTAVIDQCAMNSYLVHPWQVLLGRTTLGTPASYEPGDFMLHFAGKKGRVRLSLVDYYFPRAQKAMEEFEASSKSPEGGTATISRIGGGGTRRLTGPGREPS